MPNSVSVPGSGTAPLPGGRGGSLRSAAPATGQNKIAKGLTGRTIEAHHRVVETRCHVQIPVGAESEAPSVGDSSDVLGEHVDELTGQAIEAEDLRHGQIGKDVEVTIGSEHEIDRAVVPARRKDTKETARHAVVAQDLVGDPARDIQIPI